MAAIIEIVSSLILLFSLLLTAVAFVPASRSRVHVAGRSTATAETTTSSLCLFSPELNDSWEGLSAKVLDSRLIDSLIPPVGVTIPELTGQAGQSLSSTKLEFLPSSLPLPSLPDIPGHLGDIVSSLTNIGSIQFPPVNPSERLNSLSDFAQLQQAFNGLSAWNQALTVAIPLFLLSMSTFYQLSFPRDDYRSGLEPYPRGEYDPIQAKVFYSNHKVVVLQRTLQLVRLSNQFIIGFLLDKYVFKCDEDPNVRTRRAQELLDLITKLGPTAIKIGQALSVRPDIIPTEYATALATLQDQVPPFSSLDARVILKDELGGKKFNELQGMTNADPVASASIGQVYKATIDTEEHPNTEVAIKVQRPNVLSEIALDLHIVREFAPFYQKYIAKSSTDLQTLANEWGRGFIAELDYNQEAQNTIRFNQEMRKRSLDAVTAPIVVQDFSTEQVLVTEWVNGKRIDQSDEADIPRLCSVALNAYLVMLLELQCLHCDPHPGNLLRTTDGRLCILDFGMTLEIDPTLQYSLLEYIAHCTSDDYERVPEDLVNMGFLKRDKLEYARRSGILEPLVYFLKQAGEGGGAKGVRERILADFQKRYPGLNEDELRKAARAEMKAQMKEAAKKESVATGITTEVEELQKKNRESFTIPPWFVYTSRAFGTLEGVSLSADENYSLIQSCFPYVAKRLVGDDSPRAQKALKELLYGAGDNVDVDRLGDLADGFSTYTTTTKTLNAVDGGNSVTTSSPSTLVVNGSSDRNGNKKDPKTKLVEAEAAITLAKDSADVLLAPEGNLVQSVLLEETALAASARFKDQMKETLVDAPQKFRDSLPFGVGSFLPRLPVEAVAPFVTKTESEEKAQQLVNKLSTMVPGSSTNGDSTGSRNNGGELFDTDALGAWVGELDPEQAALVVKELRENVPKYAPLVGQLGNKFMASLLQKASDNIETTLTELGEADKDSDPVLRAAAKGFSSVASQGASILQQQLPPTVQEDLQSTR